MKYALVLVLFAGVLLFCSCSAQHPEPPVLSQEPINTSSSEPSVMDNDSRDPKNEPYIKEVTFGFFGDSYTITHEGYIRSSTMQPSGGFEMRPIMKVAHPDKERFDKLWAMVEALDIEQLKSYDSKDYNVVVDITTADGRVIIKVSTETFKTIKPFVELSDELKKAS